jgi:serine/threonine protein kinase
MGQVWLARRADGLYEAQAAIKLLRSDLSSAGWAQRFARERAVLARLDHPAVARLLDAGIEDGQAYLVLEYVDGARWPSTCAAFPRCWPRVRCCCRSPRPWTMRTRS